MNVERGNQRQRIVRHLSLLVTLSCFSRLAPAETVPPTTDYCRMLARDVAGKQHGFLAGNDLYYVGGAFSDTWKLREHETLGFTHPMFRDGRARGFGLGHDKWGWDYWRKMRAAYGTVIVGDERHPYPEPEEMIWRPDRQLCRYRVGGVVIEEAKFISTGDVLCAIIRTSAPVKFEFDGHSFTHRGFLPTHDGDPPKTRFSRSGTARACYDRHGNAIHVAEGGTIMTKRDWGTPAVEGPIMLDGMHVVLSASAEFGQTCTIEREDDGRQVYRFTVDCTPQKPLVLAYAIGDDYAPTLARVEALLADPQSALVAKTRYINHLLNRQIPYFRCSDGDVVKTYYYLWSLYFLYHTHTGKGWEAYPHTQTAVNNFMGLHLWDAWAYAAMGAYVADKWAFAHGNVLSWKFMLPFRNRHNALPDSFGIDWYSPGVWMNLIGTVEYAWRQYEQSGDRKFLDEVYHGLFRPLYWTGPQPSFGIEINALDDLVRMATALGKPADVEHWQAMRPAMLRRFRSPWQGQWPHYYAGKGTRHKDIWHLASMMCREMPDRWAREMVDRWVMNAEEGFLGPVPLDVRPADAPENDVFAVSTISTWLAVEGMFRHGCDAEAVCCTLGHLKGMVRDYGFPVAPECWDPEYKPWGSMYYNWDGAMNVLLLQRIAGIEYSIPDRSFTVTDHLPRTWRYVETITPIVDGGKTHWVRVRVVRTAHGSTPRKRLSVEGCPMQTLTLRPWLEGRRLISANHATSDPTEEGHAEFRFTAAGETSVEMTLSDSSASRSQTPVHHPRSQTGVWERAGIEAFTRRLPPPQTSPPPAASTRRSRSAADIALRTCRRRRKTLPDACRASRGRGSCTNRSCRRRRWRRCRVAG